MPVKIDKKRVRSLTSEERQKLNLLTIPEGSHMSAVLKDNPDRACCWLAYQDDIVGWSLIRWFESALKKGFDAYISVFVHPKNRQQGTGCLLIGKAMEFSDEKKMSACFFGPKPDQRLFYGSAGISPSRILSLDFPRTYWDHSRFCKHIGNR